MGLIPALYDSCLLPPLNLFVRRSLLTNDISLLARILGLIIGYFSCDDSTESRW